MFVDKAVCNVVLILILILRYNKYLLWKVNVNILIYQNKIFLMYKTKEVFQQETLTLILTTNGLLIFLPSALIQTQTRLFKIFIVKICMELE